MATAPKSETPDAAAAAAYLRARQLYGVMRLDRYTQPANMIGALIVCVIAWGPTPTPLLVLWVVAIWALAISRIIAAWRVSRDGPPLMAGTGEIWRIVWQTAATSLLYAIMFVYLVPRVDARGLNIVIGILTGFISAGALSLATMPRAATTWVAILCAGAYYAMLNNSPSQTLVLASALALYGIVITTCAVFMSRLFLTSEIGANAARARLVDAIESLSDGFILWARDRKPALTNTAARGIADELNQHGFPHAQGHANGTHPVEMKIADGRWMSIRERSTRDGGVVAIVSDVTEQKLAEETVAREASRYQTLMRTASDGIHVVDENGYLVEANASFLCELGYPEKSLPVINIADWDADIKREDVPRVIRTRMGMPPGIFETRHKRRDGTLYDAEVSVQTVSFDGKKYLYCSVRNITERKRALEERTALERQLHQSLKMQAVGQLTGGVAHDFNNLLAVLLGRLQLIEEELKGNTLLTDWIQSCIKTVDRGATLTRSLLAFSRQQPLIPVETDLNAIVEDMTSIMKRTLGETIEIRLICAPSLWRCEVDPGQLQNALLNLALNSRDAMPAGGTLIVETGNARLDADYAALHSEVTPGDFVMLAVSDTGEGMPPEVLERAFEPFFTTKDTGKGSGLGLSMVYGFVNQSGGHINIYSEVDRGTTARIYLPRKLIVGEAAAPPEIVVAPPSGNETILLVEDSSELRAVTDLQLGRLGYTVLAAGNAEDGLALLRKHATIHLLLTDIVLPSGVDGIQLGERAKALRPGLQVIYMTGYTEHRALESLTAIEPGRLLNKPFHSDELAASIRTALGPATTAH